METRRGARGGELNLGDFRGSLSTQRRRQPRTPRGKDIAILRYAVLATDTFERASLHDCSPDGIAIVCEKPMIVGDSFIAKLKTDRMMLVIYSVKYCRRLENGRFRIGAAFSGFSGSVEDNTEAIYAALLDAAT